MNHIYNKIITNYINEWIIPSADDEKGHNVTEKVCFTKTWIAQMDRIIKSVQLPFVNRGQIIRLAVYKLFSWIDIIPDKQLPKSDLAKIESMRCLLLEESYQIGFQDIIEDLAKIVKYCLSKKMQKRAIKNVLEVLHLAEEIKENDWKEHFTEYIKKTYKNLLDSIDDVNLYTKENN